MPTINFGNITNVGGKNVSLGSQSGFDIEALVTNLTTAKRLPAVKYEETITKNTSKITALNSLKSKLSDLKTKLNGLRNPVGLSSSASNIFDARTAFMTMSDGGTPTNFIGVSTSNGAPIGNYKIEVTQLAKNDKYTSGTFTLAGGIGDSVVQADGGGVAGKFEAGTLVINGTNITLTEGDTLNDIMLQINSVSSGTGVTASILQISDTEFQLSLSSKKTGLANKMTLDQTGVIPGSNIFTRETTDLTLDAKLKFNDTAITRSSNAITDLIKNTTFNLYQTTGSGVKIDLAIDKNTPTVATGVADMLSAYNAIRQFNAEQNATDEDGKYLETAVLNSNSAMRTVVERMSSYVNGQAAGVINPFATTDTAPIKLADLGVSFADVPAVDDGETSAPEIKSALDLDVAKLNTNIESYFDEVRKIFEFSFISSSGDLDILDRNNTVASSEFKISFASGAATLTHIDGIALTTPVALTVTGSAGNYEITGPTGTDLSALSYTHTGDDGTITFSTDEIEKKFSLDVDRTRATALKIDKLFGQTLSTPIELAYKENAKITGTWSNYSEDYSGNGISVTDKNLGKIDTKYKIVVDDSQAVGSQAWITEIDGVALSTPVYLDYNGTTITGKSGSGVAGLSITHSGNGTFEDTNTDIDKKFTLDLDRTRVATPAKVTKIFGYELASAINLTVDFSSSVISGVDAFEGLEMLYTGDGTDVIKVSMFQGIADKMFNGLEEMLDDAEGLIAMEIKGLQETNSDLEESVTRIDDQIITYRDQLLEKFSALEAAISSANQVLLLLDAQAAARDQG